MCQQVSPSHVAANKLISFHLRCHPTPCLHGPPEVFRTSGDNLFSGEKTFGCFIQYSGFKYQHVKYLLPVERHGFCFVLLSFRKEFLSQRQESDPECMYFRYFRSNAKVIHLSFRESVLAGCIIYLASPLRHRLAACNPYRQSMSQC